MILFFSVKDPSMLNKNIKKNSLPGNKGNSQFVSVFYWQNALAL